MCGPNAFEVFTLVPGTDDEFVIRIVGLQFYVEFFRRVSGDDDAAFDRPAVRRVQICNDNTMGRNDERITRRRERRGTAHPDTTSTAANDGIPSGTLRPACTGT